MKDLILFALLITTIICVAAYLHGKYWPEGDKVEETRKQKRNRDSKQYAHNKTYNLDVKKANHKSLMKRAKKRMHRKQKKG